MRPQPSIALLTFSYEIEDFLDKIKVSLESFCTEMTGGWLFGFIEALRQQGVRTVLVCVSGRVTEPASFTHTPSGSAVWVLPSPAVYRRLKRHIPKPYGRNVEQAFGSLHGLRRLKFPLFWVCKELAPYFTTPRKSLADVLRNERCEAILCQEYEYARFDFCVALGRRMGVPVFGVFQGGDYQRGRLERVVRPLTVRSCAGLIVATRRESERVRSRYGVGPAKLARIFNPLDLTVWQAVDRTKARAELGIPPGARVALWHGRVSIQQKGLDILLNTWVEVCRRLDGRELRLLLVGDGRDAPELRRLIGEFGLTNVQWVNEYVLDRDRMRRYLSAADVYVFPSRHEGFPVAPLEAMACGLPVVAADANGVEDILEDGERSGGVIVPRDDVAALADACVRILADEDLGREMGRRARNRIETHFSLEAVGPQLRDFLLTGVGTT